MEIVKERDFRLHDPAPLDAAIARLCQGVEALAPGSKTGVCIASPDRTKLERSIFPSLPPGFQQTIHDLPMASPYIGSCTAAMDGNTIITVHDVTLESRFNDVFILACLNHGVRSLQSRPVYGRNGEAIGTFVMGYQDVSEDQRFNMPFVEFAADAVGALLQLELDKSAAPSPVRKAHLQAPERMRPPRSIA